MKLIGDAISLDGPRHDNQDAYLGITRVGNDWWCAVADGVGGREGGRAASHACIEGVQVGIKQFNSMPELFKFVSTYLANKASDLNLPENMSSTLTVVRVSDGNAFVGHVGDSRVSHCRGNGILARSYDQTEVQRLLDEGVLSRHQARRYPRRNVLLSYMSAAGHYELFESKFDLKVRDRVLLTTDGFHQKLLRKTIAEISEKSSSFSDFFGRLKAEVGGIEIDDDATCVAFEVCE